MQLDIGIITLISLLTLLGFLKGFWSQVISIVAAIVGSISVYFFRGIAAEYFFKILVEKYPQVDVDISIVEFITAIFIFVFSYFIAGIIFEMVKRKFLFSLSLKLSDRFFGLLAGAFKGCIVALIVIFILIISKNYVKSFTSEQGYNHYIAWLNNSKAYIVSCDIFKKVEEKSPMFKNICESLNISFIEKNERKEEDADVWE